MSPVGFDTQVAAHLLDEQLPLNLLDQATLHLGVTNWGKGNQYFGTAWGKPEDILARQQKRPSKNNEDFASHLGDLYGEDSLGRYCAVDTAYTHLLYLKQREALRIDQPLARLAKTLSLPGVEAFAIVERNGIWLDQSRVHTRDAELAERIMALDAELRGHVDPMLLAEAEAAAAKRKTAGTRSVFQNDNFLREWIYGRRPRGLGLEPIAWTTARHEPATDEKTIARLDHPALSLLKEIKELQKRRDFFRQWLFWLGDDGRIHPYFNLALVVTGRRSCDTPNLQQVPKIAFMRACFGAAPGYLFLEIDYSQIEVRIMAWLSGDANMLEVFKTSGDIYRYVAARIRGVPESEITKQDRNRAKPVVLGFQYGMGAKKFVQYALDQYGIEFTLAEATAIRNLFFSLFPGLVSYHERQRRTVHAKGWVQSPTGRYRHLTNIHSHDHIAVGDAERQAINSPIQGTGGDMNLASLIELLNETLDPEEARVVGDIHDALLFEIREADWMQVAEKILRVMENPRHMVALLAANGEKFPLRMLAEGTIGTHWKDENAVEFNLDGVGGKAALADLADLRFERAA